MAAPTLTSLPDSITAGDTLAFQIQLSDYSAADGWTLSYDFIRDGSGELITFSGTNNAGAHSITVSAATTAAWVGGNYRGQAYVTKTTERHTVWQGKLLVNLNYASGTVPETRSQAKQILDALYAAAKDLVVGKVTRVMIEGVEFQYRDNKDIQQAIQFWETRVAAEDAKLTGKSRRALLAVFTRPQCASPFPINFPF